MNDRETLIEQIVTAHRERDEDGRLQPPPAWWDLSPEDAERSVRLQLETREMERVVDRMGWSTTVRAVMYAIRF